WLVEYINENPGFIQPDYRRNETLGFLRKPLSDLCISRPKTRLNWGIELPFDSDYVTYVWFDALVNYITGPGYLQDNERFERWWPASYHLIGKDILTTHTVYWPCMLKAMGLPMPETVFAHGWWLTGKDKMSKSAGNVLDPMGIVDRYGVDAFRYFLMAEMSLGQDASFTSEAFVRRYNTDLANDLGNMLSRVTKLIRKHCDGKIPEPGDVGEDEFHLRDMAIRAAEQMVKAVEGMRLDQGIAGLAAVVRESNRYFETKQPWTLAREGRLAELGTTLYCVAEALRVVSGMLYPVMPGKMALLRRTLGLSDTEPDFSQVHQWGGLKPGTEMGEQVILFARIRPGDDANAQAAVAAPKKEEESSMIEYSDFEKIKLRTATIVTAERVEGADKLLRLEVKLGDERRQIVAGIAKQYDPEKLVGTTVVLVSNLKPAKIRGIESNGMLLAAVDGDQLRLIVPDGEMPGGVSVQ
ncbi:MAG: methionine--tRNA ligase subunit beta, partial [Lentisphaerae bacterium]|nr:methionine--tRNA ligase subunit beta [Lentisphaerota bacterium]